MSMYFNSLEGEVKARYLDKIKLIDNIDPYDCDESLFTSDIAHFPQISFHELHEYFVHILSFYTKQEFKSYKSLDAYRFFKCGWVRDIHVRSFKDNVLVCGTVLHSQRVKQKPAKPWFISTKDGEILCAHCDCIAGLGESCSHNAAVMFAIEQAVRDYEPTSVTGIKSAWVVPTNKVGEMSTWQACTVPNLKGVKSSVSATPNLLDTIMEMCKINDYCPASMLVRLPYSSEIQQEVEKKRNSSFAFSLYKEEYEQKTLNELRKIAESIDLTIDALECIRIEKTTRAQAKSDSWFQHRAGRITASNFKNACRTKIEKPAMSTLKSICYPQSTRFYSKITEYGCIHEKPALDIYKTTMSSTHQNFNVIQSVGLIINPAYPHFGASPDGIAKCDCCGKGCVEIKCPHCAREKSISELVMKKTFCLDPVSNKLKTDHSYYYQIQMQLALSEYAYCDFVIWSSTELLIERISFDMDFWKTESDKATRFWKLVVLPELLGKYYTKCIRAQQTSSTTFDAQPSTSYDPQSSTVADYCKPVDAVTTWCFCGKSDNSLPMICCYNKSCTIKWFHMDCVGLKKDRKIWKCSNCK